MSDSARSVPDWVVRLADRARAVDGAPPFSDQAVVDYRTGARELTAVDEVAAALVAETEAEFVVDPDARGLRIGTALLETLLSTAVGPRLFWAHGDHPAARALAASHGLTAVRELLHLSRQLADEKIPVPTQELESFRTGTDEDEWVALNALIFSAHPEQGSVTRADLLQLEGESWFAANDFLLLRDASGRMIGYCWLKVEGDRGEFYVVGVHPDHQGEKLGSLLFDAGLAHLAAHGIRVAHLYVEGDNTPALGLYSSRGFTRDSIDIQYVADRPPAPAHRGS
ncbi:MAG TPA: mycothiol synthase [Galbitalea sp.]|jgi:mycothiol synthase